MNIQKILVPVDFSVCSALVVRQAAGLAKQLGAQLVILHVAELPPGISPNTHLQIDGEDQTAAAYLSADTLARLKPLGEMARTEGVEAKLEIRFGPVVTTILAATDATQADLVVIGTHGRTGFARMMLGSIAEGVAHKAHVPVMLVRRETRPECARQSCEWCPHEGRSPAEERIAAESQG